MKQFPSLYVARNHGCIERCLILSQCIMGEYKKYNVKHLLYSSWERRRVNLIFSPDLARDMSFHMKQFPSLYVVLNHGYIQRYLIFIQCMVRV